MNLRILYVFSLVILNQFAKALDVEGSSLNYIFENFPKFGMEKLKSGLFVGPQIRQFMRDTDFIKFMSVPESEVCQGFVFEVEGFLCNHKASNHE